MLNRDPNMLHMLNIYWPDLKRFGMVWEYPYYWKYQWYRHVIYLGMDFVDLAKILINMRLRIPHTFGIIPGKYYTDSEMKNLLYQVIGRHIQVKTVRYTGCDTRYRDSLVIYEIRMLMTKYFWTENFVEHKCIIKDGPSSDDPKYPTNKKIVLPHIPIIVKVKFN